MKRLPLKRLLVVSGVLMLIALCMGLRVFTRNNMLPSGFGMLRNVIHVSLLALWAVSLRLRIIHTHVRRYLMAVSIMMILWLLLKAINYSIDNMDVNRWLWYLYYIPMLFIPVFALFVSMLLGNAEDYRLPRIVKLLYIPTAILLMLVLTNDFHEMVFSFPEGVKTPLIYKHEAGYYVIFAWIALCALTAFFIMLSKCRIPRKKAILFLPLIPIVLSLIYSVMYIRNVSLVLLLAGDMTVTHCLLIAAAFEGCIECGLIQSNIGYNELFNATTLPIQITDTNFLKQNTSLAMKETLPQDKLSQMNDDTVLIGENTLLKRHPLRDGWVFWKEDISELKNINRELRQTQEELKDTGNDLAVEKEQNEKLLRLSEENRLYDMMESETSDEVSMLKECLEKIHTTDDLEESRRLLKQIIIIGTYIKRRNNLIFAGAKSGFVSVQELRLCLNESMENLTLYGADCKSIVNGDGLLTIQQAAEIYDLFEAVAEAELMSLKSLLISVEIMEYIDINICVYGDEALYGLKDKFPNSDITEDEDGLKYISQTLELRKAAQNGQD